VLAEVFRVRLIGGLKDLHLFQHARGSGRVAHLRGKFCGINLRMSHF
jgi:hypothetical protein